MKILKYVFLALAVLEFFDFITLLFYDKATHELFL